MLRVALTEMLDEQACYNYPLKALHSQWLALSARSPFTIIPSPAFSATRTCNELSLPSMR